MPEAKPAMRKLQQQRETAPSPSATPAPAMQQPDLENQIRVRAYELWLQNGQPDGRDVEHWLQAEAEILAARSRAA
jgi:Protein of unknown function (DUF2934)